MGAAGKTSPVTIVFNTSLLCGLKIHPAPTCERKATALYSLLCHLTATTRHGTSLTLSYPEGKGRTDSTTAELDSASEVHCTNHTCDTSLKKGLQKEVTIKFPFQSTKILHLLIKFQLGPQAIEQNTGLATAFCFAYCY